jgi:carbonic anhydrase
MSLQCRTRGFAALAVLNLALMLVVARSQSAGAAEPAAAATAAPVEGKLCDTQNSKACQSAVTPDQVLDALKQGNQRFAQGLMTQRSYSTQVRETAAGQFPVASIVSCIDSRVPAEIVFDRGIGDVFNARVAGNIVNPDILGSLEYASKVAGSKLIVVLGHSHCGAIKGTCDGVKMGNLTGLLAKIQPAVNAVHTKPGEDRTSKNHHFVEEVAERNVKDTVQAIRKHSHILQDMEAQGEIGIVGAMYDVETGQVAWLE